MNNNKTIKLRPSIKKFAEMMEKRMKENDHKTLSLDKQINV